jgi:hypothetical protein
MYNKPMTMSDIVAARLHNQGLLTNFSDPVEVVRRLVAVQAQDFTGAKWALGLRCETTDEEVTRLFNEGKILRTHILRPTWHFVLPEDIRWMQALTAPRVHAFCKYYFKKMHIDEAATKTAHAALRRALQGGKYLTKAEINKVFEAAGLEEIGGLRYGFLIMHAELEALVCSGPLNGKQHTYALLEERAPQAKPLPRDEALAELTRRFFDAHGPAQVADFAWWSSLTMADCKKGIELAKLKNIEIDDKTYFYTRAASPTLPSPVVHLLPNYDEYFIAYKDRSAYSQYRTFKVSRNPEDADLFNHVMTLDGQLAAGWKRKVTTKELTVDLTLFTKLTNAQQKALHHAAARLEKFIGLPVKLT